MKLLLQVPQVLVLGAVVASQVKVDLRTAPPKQDHPAPNCMGEPDLVVHAGTLSRQIGEEEFSRPDLIQDSLCDEILVLDVVRADSSDTELVKAALHRVGDVVKGWLIRIHPHHDERRSRRDAEPSWSISRRRARG